MAILNPRYVSEGRVMFELKSGARFDAELRINDPIAEVFWVERSEGVFEPIPYAEFACAKMLSPRRSQNAPD